MPNAAFTALLTDVYALTKRPDLVAETAYAVKAATLKAHKSDYYPKDIVESGVVFDTSSYVQTLAHKELFPYWRSLAYARKTTETTPSTFFEIISPTDILDSYGVEKADVCYLAGSSYQFRSSDNFQYLLLGYYSDPVIDPELYSSWIAQEQSPLIVYDAAATIFKTIGYDEQNAAYRDMVSTEIALLKQNNILAEGY